MTSESPSNPGTEKRVLHLASFDDRFLAWLIDVILVGIAVGGLGGVGATVVSTTGEFGIDVSFAGMNGLGFWIYWTVLEGYHGQSAGKMVMDLRVTDERGDDVDYVKAAIQSFGKAFLLPLDVIVGWLATDDESVRLFQKLAGTIVVEMPDDEQVPEDVEYVRPDD